MSSNYIIRETIENDQSSYNLIIDGDVLKLQTGLLNCVSELLIELAGELKMSNEELLGVIKLDMEMKQ